MESKVAKETQRIIHISEDFVEFYLVVSFHLLGESRIYTKFKWLIRSHKQSSASLCDLCGFAVKKLKSKCGI